MIPSNLVRKIEKAKDYAMQPERVTLNECSLQFRGDNGDHKISYAGGKWNCDCHYFSVHETCSHTMATQMLLEDVVPAETSV